MKLRPELNNPNVHDAVSPNREEDISLSVVPPSGEERLLVERLIDNLNLSPEQTKILKSLAVPLVKRLISSPYIDSSSSNQVHLQSFALGIAVTYVISIVHPFIMIYLDGWILFWLKLLKNLVGWAVVGGALHYFFSRHNSISPPEDSIEGHQEQRENRFQELQYTVKKSRDSSPKKAKVSFAKPQMSSEKVLMKLTEQQQNIERAKQDVNMSRPELTYSKFVGMAEEHDEYKKLAYGVSGRD